MAICKSCYDCIFAVHDGPDRESGPGNGAVYCNETGKTISDPWGYGDQEICKKFRNREVMSIWKREYYTIF